MEINSNTETCTCLLSEIMFLRVVDMKYSPLLLKQCLTKLASNVIFVDSDGGAL